MLCVFVLQYSLIVIANHYCTLNKQSITNMSQLSKTLELPQEEEEPREEVQLNEEDDEENLFKPVPRADGSPAKKRDERNQIVWEDFIGDVSTIDVQKATGDVAYKAPLNKAVSNKFGKTKDLNHIDICSQKENAASEEVKKVGKSNAIDKIIVAPTPETESKREKLNETLATTMEKVTPAYNSKSQPPKVRPQPKVIKDKRKLDEVLLKKDVAGVVAVLYPDKSIFDDERAVRIILSRYFSLIDLDEAKELVLAEYEN